MVRRAAVLGHPIAHSQSPFLHSAAYDFLGLDIDYRRIDVPEALLPEFLAGEGAATGWLGWSVTMPLKSAMVDAVAHRSPRVQALGVLNTVIHRPGAQADAAATLHGENTDVDGIVAALGEAGLRSTADRDEASFGIIGAGATATAALAAAAELGYTHVRSYARSAQRAAELEPIARSLGLKLRILPLVGLIDDLRDETASPEAVVSTLPPRAADELARAVPNLPTAVPLLDVAYDPWPSQLASSWESAGGHVVSGLVMLLHQAVKQVELFTANTESPAGELPSESHAALVAKMRRSIGL